MTRKHFELLAREISMIVPAQARKLAAEAAIRACLQINQNFDPDKFRKACDV